MKLSKWFKPKLCECYNDDWPILYWLYHKRVEQLHYFLTRALVTVYFLITVRPLFFMTFGSGKLLVPCNGTDILPFEKFEKVVIEYKALKRVIINIQTSKNINAISHYYESYRTPRIKVFEELLSMWERLDELYQAQKIKYLECYYRNRDAEHESLKLQKWIIPPYPVVLLIFMVMDLVIFFKYKSSLPKFEYAKLELKWKKFELEIIVLSISMLIPELFLPKLVYFLDYWFFVDGYLGL